MLTTEIPLSKPSQILLSLSWYNERTVLLFRPLDLSYLVRRFKFESRKITPFPTVPKAREKSFNCKELKIVRFLSISRKDLRLDNLPERFLE